eukprot:m.206160 g.206160  ORF g.206160 m.206160 type:complete len:575 (+) comp32944_c0_seq1:402-2126(+)
MSSHSKRAEFGATWMRSPCTSSLHVALAAFCFAQVVGIAVFLVVRPVPSVQLRHEEDGLHFLETSATPRIPNSTTAFHTYTVAVTLAPSDLTRPHVVPSMQHSAAHGMPLNQLVRSRILQAVGALPNFVDDKTHLFMDLTKGINFNGSGWETVNSKWRNQSLPRYPILVGCKRHECMPSLTKTGLEGLHEDVRIILLGVFEQNFGGFGQAIAGVHGGANTRGKPEGESIMKILDDKRLVAWFVNQMPIDVHAKLVSVPLGIHYSWNANVIENVYKANKTLVQMKKALARCVQTDLTKDGVCEAAHDFIYNSSTNDDPTSHVVPSATSEFADLGVPFVPRGGEFSYRSQLFEFIKTTMEPRLNKGGKTIVFMQNCSGDDPYKQKCPMMESYFKMLQTTNFCVSPGGLGFDCYRTYESLLMGCVPIVLSSPLDKSYHRLPIVTVGSFTDITPAFLEQAEITLRAQILNGTIDFSRLKFEYWRQLMINTSLLHHDQQNTPSFLLQQLPLPRWKTLLDNTTTTANATSNSAIISTQPQPSIAEWFETSWTARKQRQAGSIDVHTISLADFMMGGLKLL